MNDQEKKEKWLCCPALTEELRTLLMSMDDQTAHDCFYRNLAFGTGGLRGVLGAGSNRMNEFTVIKATRGLGRYLLSHYTEPSCAVSYDSRIHSRDFAELSASVLAEMNIPVWIYPQLEPTPMLSFAVRHLHTSAGIMITASHNPAKYNGYKVYGDDGCQITLDAAEQIQHEIDLQPELTDAFPSFQKHLSSGLIKWIPQETVEAYYQAIMKLRVKKVDCPLHLVYSPLNGTGNIPVREIMNRLGNIHVDIVQEQEKPDGRFPSCPYPNPEIREAMKLLIQKTIETKADLCFATDPDCDRMGAGVRIGDNVILISGNDMGILMLDYLCRNISISSDRPPVVVKTIVTTDMAALICRKYHLELRNVLTGFKYIGEQIGFLEASGQDDRFLFGFEESCGYLSGTDVRDKDAVNAALLLCDMAADLKSQGKTMIDRLNELRSEFGLFDQRLLSYQYEGEDGLFRMKEIMEDLRCPQDSSSDTFLRNAERTDYLKDHTGLPQSDVLSFVFSDGDKMIIRPSGTEPKMKAYLFTRAKDQKTAQQKLDNMQMWIDQKCKP
jgi:phosphoglucomutase